MYGNFGEKFGRFSLLLILFEFGGAVDIILEFVLFFKRFTGV